MRTKPAVLWRGAAALLLVACQIFHLPARLNSGEGADAPPPTFSSTPPPSNPSTRATLTPATPTETPTAAETQTPTSLSPTAVAAGPRPTALASLTRPLIVLNTERGMFPEEWSQPPISATATDLDPGEFRRSLQTIQFAMSLYPVELILTNLNRVYVVGSLSFSGIQASGTNSLDRLYIANGGLEEGYSNSFVEATFHHEFSSILLRNYSQFFDQDAWLALNPPDFEYGSGGVEAVRSGRAGEVLVEDFYRLGFLNEYAMASVEEDFNEVAQHLFMGDKEFWQAVDEYEVIRAKVLLAIKLYRALDPVYNEAYFRSLI